LQAILQEKEEKRKKEEEEARIPFKKETMLVKDEAKL
jgi:hypothetical protein